MYDNTSIKDMVVSIAEDIRALTGINVYYGVTSIYDSSGCISAKITKCHEGSNMPANTYICKDNKDVFVDWFNDRDMAESFAEEIVKKPMVTAQ